MNKILQVMIDADRNPEFESVMSSYLKENKDEDREVVMWRLKFDTLRWLRAVVIQHNPEKVKITDVNKAWKELYSQYIQSDVWEYRACVIKAKFNYRCQLCNKHKEEIGLHAHHRTYERLGNELLEDITVLCADCHAKFHDKVSDGQ